MSSPPHWHRKGAVGLFISALLLGLGASAVGCSQAPPGGPTVVFDACEGTRLHVAEDASDDERASVETALALWRQVGGPPLAMADSRDGTTDEGAVQTLPLGFEPAAPLFFGLYRPDRGDILINREIAVASARSITIAHELGHAFGLVHIKDRPSLMNPGNLVIPPAAEDAAAIYAARGPCRQP